jgi:hypothetical protein
VLPILEGAAEPVSEDIKKSFAMTFSGFLTWKPGETSMSSPWFTVQDDDGMGFCIDDILKHFDGKDVKITISLNKR